MKSDGFRGKYGEGWVTESIFYRLPFALQEVLGFNKVAIAHDPRPSSPLLYDALVSGAKAAGISVIKADMMPTPMLAKWCYDQGIVGLMVTASHNPVSDNGLKCIGFSLDEIQREHIAECLKKRIRRTGRGESRSAHLEVKSGYKEALKALNLSNKRCLIDTAQGAWHPHLDVLEDVGFSVDRYESQDQPDRINQTGCVVIHSMMDHYPKGYDYIIAFDGDGDRLQMVRDNVLLDGDDILCHLAQKESRVVGTILTNQGVEETLLSQGIQLYRSKVGDQRVRKLMLDKKARFGGEPCGHILDSKWMGYSDPVYIAAYALSLGDIKPIKKHYQYQVNLPDTADIQALKQKLQHPKVRCVIRRSNTEPLVRVMLEGDKSLILSLVESYALNSLCNVS